MDYDSTRFDQQETAAELVGEVELEAFDDSDDDEVQLLVARVRAARLAGA